MNIFEHIENIDSIKVYDESTDIYCNESEPKDIIYDDIKLMEESDSIIENKAKMEDGDFLYKYYKGGFF